MKIYTSAEVIKISFGIMFLTLGMCGLFFCIFVKAGQGAVIVNAPTIIALGVIALIGIALLPTQDKK